MNMPKSQDKPFEIPKVMVWEAYKRVAAVGRPWRSSRLI